MTYFAACHSSERDQPLIPALLQPAAMAAETDWSCPICRESPGEKASVTPCVHQFCLGCIVRWAKWKPSCPLCRLPIKSIIYSVRSEDDFLEIALPGSSDASAAGHQEDQGAAQAMPSTHVAGFPPELWASIFQECSEVLEPLLPWLNQELSEVLRTRWWEVALAQSVVVATLCYYGLSEEALVRELQALLQEQTATFVRRLISTAADRCNDEILRRLNLLNSLAQEEQEEQEQQEQEQQEQEGQQEEQQEQQEQREQQEEQQEQQEQGPAVIPTTCQETPTPILVSTRSLGVSSVEADAGTLETTPGGGPGSSPSSPIPAEGEQPQEEPGRAAAVAVAVAGPSAQGCSRSPCTPGRDTLCLPEEPRRRPKRKASGHQESPQPPKRLSRRRQQK